MPCELTLNNNLEVFCVVPTSFHSYTPCFRFFFVPSMSSLVGGSSRQLTVLVLVTQISPLQSTAHVLQFEATPFVGKHMLAFMMQSPESWKVFAANYPTRRRLIKWKCPAHTHIVQSAPWINWFMSSSQVCGQAASLNVVSFW